jgi:glucose/arabinose dehydrogenase
MQIRRGLTRMLAGGAIVLLTAGTAAAQLRAIPYVTGLSSPVGIVQDPSNAGVKYVLEQGGLIKVVQTGTVHTTPFLDLTSAVSTGGERGLLGLAFPANYAATGSFWVQFTNPDGHTVVSRFQRSSGDPFVADPTSRFDLLWPGGQRFVVQPFANHNGGHLAFGPDGYLYIGMGDGGSSNDPDHNAQSPATLLGKMLRIDVNVDSSVTAGYRVPPDNPFVSSGVILPEIWSFGYRNPWRYSFDDPALGGTGALIVGDVGQGAREEIDYEPANRGGRNYGWRNKEGTLSNVTDRPPLYEPLTDPIFDYGHDAGVAVTGGFVYRGATLAASYRGRYFFADFGSGRVWSLALSIAPGTGEATAIGIDEHTSELGGAGVLGNISSFGVDAGGELYLCSFNGTIFRIAPGATLPNPQMYVDLPSQGATVTQPFVLAGWALDATAASGTGVSTLHAWAFPSSGGPARFVGVPAYGGARPDVGGLFGSQFTPSGWGLSVSGLPPDSYRLIIFGWVDAMRTFGVQRSVDVTIVASSAMSIDVPAQDLTIQQPFHLGGWALDRAAPTGTGVDTIHVWAFPVAPAGSPVFVGVPALGGARPDVGAFFGAQFTPSGYNMLVSGLSPGAYDVVVFAHSSVTNSFDAAQVLRVTVQ